MNKLISRAYLSIPKKERYTIRKYYKLLSYSYKNIFAEFVRAFTKHKKIDNINLFEQRVYSQNGEDGIIRIIFDKIGVTNKFCVEFGVEEGVECNTRYLIDKKGWNFLHMDCGDNLPKSIKKEKVTAENINLLFKKYKVPKEFDLLSIDIDFNDYWVWKAIKSYSPRVVVIEYNGSIPPNESKVVKYDPSAIWDGTNYFGASLLALKKLGVSKGYTLIGCNNRGINAFFVRNDLIKNNFLVRPIEKIYRSPKSAIGFFAGGHPPSNKKMMNI